MRQYDPSIRLGRYIRNMDVGGFVPLFSVGTCAHRLADVHQVAIFVRFATSIVVGRRIGCTRCAARTRSIRSACWLRTSRAFDTTSLRDGCAFGCVDDVNRVVVQCVVSEYTRRDRCSVHKVVYRREVTPHCRLLYKVDVVVIVEVRNVFLCKGKDRSQRTQVGGELHPLDSVCVYQQSAAARKDGKFTKNVFFRCTRCEENQRLCKCTQGVGHYHRFFSSKSTWRAKIARFQNPPT